MTRPYMPVFMRLLRRLRLLAKTDWSAALPREDEILASPTTVAPGAAIHARARSSGRKGCVTRCPG